MWVVLLLHPVSSLNELLRVCCRSPIAPDPSRHNPDPSFMLCDIAALQYVLPQNHSYTQGRVRQSPRARMICDMNQYRGMHRRRRRRASGQRVPIPRWMTYGTRRETSSSVVSHRALLRYAYAYVCLCMQGSPLCVSLRLQHSDSEVSAKFVAA